MADPALPGTTTQTDDADPQAERQTAAGFVQILEGYRTEATDARKTGMNPRDAKWEENMNLYWGRMDFSDKAAWQSKEVMPEVSSFVDRFAAAMKDALHSSPTGFYTIIDEADKEHDLTDAMKRAMDVWLSGCGTDPFGHPLAFGSVFEETMKTGAIMACASSVSWREDRGYGYVCLENQDPRSLWFDHTGRNLYRIRRIELDKHELVGLAKEKDSSGKPLYNVPEVQALREHMDFLETEKRRESSGTGQEVSSNRIPVTLDEYYATVLDPDGRRVHEKALFIVGNERFLLRGPEPNPFMHGKDWVTYAPLIVSPLSPYGRSYMEDFGSVASTFNKLTNMLLDAVVTSSMKAFAAVPDLLRDPTQLNTGIKPNKVFILDDGSDPRQFLQEIDLGSLPAESITLWQALKKELTEAAKQNEIGIGQFAPKSRTSATEIATTNDNSSALLRSIAATVEGRWLEPTLNIMWRTGIQHVKKSDTSIMRAVGGQEMFDAILARRKEFATREFNFQARGISTLLQKSQKLKTLLSALQVISASDIMLKAFMQQISVPQLVDQILNLFDIDTSNLKATPRQGVVNDLTNVLNSNQAGAEARTAGQNPSPEAQGQAAGLAGAIQGLTG